MSAGWGIAAATRWFNDLMVEIIEGECKDGAGKEHCRNNKMVGVLLDVR